MASGELSMTSNSSQEGSNHDFGCYPNERSRKPSTESAKNFETIKQQYDQAIMELNVLRKQQTDGKVQMERIMEQLEFYRNKYVADMDQGGGGNTSSGMPQSTLKATTNLRTKFEDISNENIRLQQRIQYLEKKLLRQEKESTNSQAVCAFVEEYNELKNKYESSRLEFEKLSKETVICKKLCSDLSRDRELIVSEKENLKQQLSRLLPQLDGAIREKSRLHDAHKKLLQQHDDSMKELSQVMQARADELRRVTAQRNAAELELRTILGERKDVLEENQKLNDDLAAAKEELEKYYKNDEDLKRKIDSLVRYQNEVIIERNNLREVLESKEMLKTRDSAWGEDVSASKDKFEQHNLDLDASNKEIEKLRKNLDKAKMEIEKATQETDVAKSRRDWAITEREKIVLERDSVKTLCDELRKERDTAVSDLLEAIRDSEQIKKQKDEACKEVEQLREQLESQLNTSQRNVLWGYMPYDIPQNDTEVLEIDMSEALLNGDIGIMLEGGREDSQNRIDGSIVVVGIAKDSPAYGKLRVNDCIMQVNNLDCSSVTKRMVTEAIRNGGQQCEIVVKRPRLTKSHMYEVQLNIGGNRTHGLTLETGIFISKIAPKSLAAKENELAAGDRVLSINNKSMDGVTGGKEAMIYLDDNRSDTITIIGLKQIKESSDLDAYAQVKPNRVINSCTQTDERYNIDVEANRTSSSSNSKSTSKISEMFNKFRGKIHIHGHQKGSTASESDSLCQENDAIAVLDSVINNENSSASSKVKDNLFKRSKKSKKESAKEANKNLGTWPRANILNTSNAQENPTGTIVQHRKKERPALSLFTGPISLGKEEKTVSSSKKENYFTPVGHENVSNQNASKPSISNMTNSNRNSNPIPFHVLYPPPPSVLNRHSVYSALESEPVLLESGKSIPSKMSDVNNHKYHHHHHHHNVVLNNNRLSLNITPSLDNSLLYNTVIHRKNPALSIDSKGQIPSHPSSLDYVALKNSTDSLLNSKSPMSSLDFKPGGSGQQQDLISLKSQNSIDSFLSPKSPPSIDMLSASKPLLPRDGSDFYMTKRLSKHVSKFPSDSDSLGMESISSPGSNNYTSTLPSYSLNARAQSTAPPSSRNQRLFPSPHSHLLRQTSPLTIPVTQNIDISANNSADKLEFDYGMQSIHSHGISMDIDPYHRNKIHPVRDRDIIFGSYALSYEGGTFPRKKENQRVRIPSNPSVASRSSDVKNSTGSIERGGSEHSTPMPPAYKVEILSHGGGNNKRGSMLDYSPSPGDIRRVTIDKSAEPLGITIQCNNNGGGIFVSTVTANSIASQVN